ncbi:putative hydrophobin [Sordaria brevicollis]|uniref:Hydrophobin n=1 Tax=Sordaria brevicollis TaxID=83679 RepID=A0AAE0PBQ6_SORBR|nr:putative hydrophobin [Sordaria brevicollis]
MQFSTIATFLTLAMSAAAAPAPEVVARTTVEPCVNGDYKPYCCQTTPPTGLVPILLAQVLGVNIADLLQCGVAAVGGQCSQNVKCCKGTAVNNGNSLIFIGNVQCLL